MIKIITTIVFLICSLVSAQGQFEQEMGKIFQLWETDTKPMCAQIEKAIGLFATFKSEIAFSPKWGLDRALEAQKNCK